MVEYKILNTTNLKYDPVKIEKMCLLYEGGYKMMDNASLFLKKLQIENQKSFRERMECASYLPYMSQFVDHFSASLFSDELIVREASDADDEDTLGEPVHNQDFYKLFSANADGVDNSLHNFMKDVFTEALYGKCAYVGVDFASGMDEEAPTNLLEEEMMGLDRAYLYCVDPKTVVDWKKDYTNNKFEWIKIKYDTCVQEDPLALPMHKVGFKIWTMRNGVAHWAWYESKELPLNKEPRNSDDIPLVAEGDTSFKEIPVFELSIPKGLHIGFKLGPVCEEIFQRRSFLVSNMNKTCIAIPVVKLGPEIPAPGEPVPSISQQNPNRANMMSMNLVNQGYTVLGKDDDLVIREASGASHSLVDKQLNELVEKMHQLVNQMAQSVGSNTKALNRSAMSKKEDRHSTEILLTAYARCVKDFVKEIYQCIATARNESVVWSVHGLSTFVEEDRSDILEEVKSVAGQTPVLDIIPSETFRKKYLIRLATALVGTSSPEEEQQMQEEIENGVENQEHQQLASGQPVALTGDTMADEAKETDPQDKAAFGGAGEETMAMGPGGQPLLPDGAHLQTGEHVDAQVVFDQLAEDYNEKDIEFVKHIPWIGPVEVPLSSIDFSNKDNWQASQEPDEVEKFADKMATDNFNKPVILVNNPSNDNKMMVVDGHHRSLAALQNGQPVNAYVGQVGSTKGPWDKLHSKQVGSMQEASIQKEISQQVNRSEKAKNGKTK